MKVHEPSYSHSFVFETDILIIGYPLKFKCAEKCHTVFYNALDYKAFYSV